VKPYINLVEVHPQLSNNRHPVDGALVGAGSLWPSSRMVTNYPQIPSNNEQGVWPCHFTLKSILRQKKKYGNSNISPCKNTCLQKILTIYQN
jgi:hypothetical protein